MNFIDTSMDTLTPCNDHHTWDTPCPSHRLMVTLDGTILPGEHRMLSPQVMHALGVAGTTPIFVRRLQEKERTIGLSHGDKLRPEFEARMGFALLGHTNMRPEDFEACGHDPFHEEFMDNFAVGLGSTVADAVDALRKELDSISQGLFA